jgi:hypothetical protein
MVKPYLATKNQDSHTSEDSSESWLFNNQKDGVWRKIGFYRNQELGIRNQEIGISKLVEVCLRAGIAYSEVIFRKDTR